MLEKLEKLSREDVKFAKESVSLDKQAVDAITRNPGDGTYPKLREVNTDISREHLAQHFDQYVETARQDAQAAGVDVHLTPQTKE